MHVYVAIEEWPYEYTEIRGVFSTEAAAEAHIATLRAKAKKYIRFEVQEWVIDHPELDDL